VRETRPVSLAYSGREHCNAVLENLKSDGVLEKCAQNVPAQPVGGMRKALLSFVSKECRAFYLAVTVGFETSPGPLRASLTARFRGFSSPEITRFHSGCGQGVGRMWAGTK
jgi:hypothetical protein